MLNTKKSILMFCILHFIDMSPRRGDKSQKSKPTKMLRNHTQKHTNKRKQGSTMGKAKVAVWVFIPIDY